MNEFVIGNKKITYETMETNTYNIKVSEEIYIEENALSDVLVGEVDMSVYKFYQADNPELTREDYELSESFKQIITRFPHTNTEKISLEKEMYEIKQVPVFITVKDYLVARMNPEAHEVFLVQLEKIQKLALIKTNERQMLPDQKVKQLMTDGTYGVRTYICDSQKSNERKIQEKLVYGDEFYGFGSYSYAGYIEFLPEYEVLTYDEFHEQYGKYIYSMTIKKNDVVIPLLWPDYLYHRPENHLEFGVLSEVENKRYELFNDWKMGDKVQIEVLADGFEDVHFTSYLRKPLEVKPKLSKKQYLLGEDIVIELGEDILDEISLNHEIVKIIPPKKETISSQIRINDESNFIVISTNEQYPTGHYQIRVNSDIYGQLLIVATLKKEKE